MIKVLFLILPILVLSQPNETNKYNATAVSFTRKAAQLGTLNRDNLRRDVLAKKVISILDTAITYDKSYPYAYLAKMGSLTELKMNASALECANKAIKVAPTLQQSYYKAAVVAEFYMKNKTLALDYYKKVYNIALQESKIKNHTNLSSDLKLANAIVFNQGKDKAYAFLDDITKYYSKDSNSLQQIKVERQLVATPITQQSAWELLHSYNY